MQNFILQAKLEQIEKFGPLFQPPATQCDNSKTIKLECAIIGLSEPNPEGYRMMNTAEVIELKDQICKYLSHYAIVAFDHGKLAGSGYNFEIQMNYGNECGQKFIVKYD